MFQINNNPHNLKILPASVIISLLSCFDNIECLDLILPEKIISFLKSNYIGAQYILQRQFSSKVKIYSENPYNFHLNSLLEIVNKVACRNSFEVLLNYGQVIDLVPQIIGAKYAHTFFYRYYCLKCANIQIRNKKNLVISFKRNIKQKVLPVKLEKYTCIENLISSNCF